VVPGKSWQAGKKGSQQIAGEGGTAVLLRSYEEAKEGRKE
jgi:hypothetical protein